MQICGLTIALVLACGPPGLRVAPQPAQPIVIAHRGASGYLPEHTIAAYELAIEQGADFIEPDLVVTRDGVLIARHEPEIGETTDAAEVFPSRRATKTLHGRAATGWFAEDFTLEEIRRLRARQRVKTRSAAHDGKYLIPTLDEVLALAARRGKERGRVVGVYPELKAPGYLRAQGHAVEELLVAALRARSLDDRAAPVFAQSFEPASLRRLHSLSTVRLVQLIASSGGPEEPDSGGLPGGYAGMLAPEQLRRIAMYAAGIGAEKSLVLPTKGDSIGPATSLVRDAHTAGLLVHVWTLRSDAPFLPAAYRGNATEEVRRLVQLGVDGFFTDQPDVTLAALRPR